MPSAKGAKKSRSANESLPTSVGATPTASSAGPSAEIAGSSTINTIGPGLSTTVTLVTIRSMVAWSLTSPAGISTWAWIWSPARFMAET
ncbi:MAG: hypothetical protein V9G10_14410 [Candidatus Nanopelagicales bacterium]